MKNVFILVFLFFASQAISNDANEVHLMTKGHHEVVARLKAKTYKEIIFIALEDTTSEIEITLKADLEKIDKYPEGYQAKFCFDIAESCNWSCQGKFIGYVEAVFPWKKLKLEDMIKKVKNCEYE